MQNELVRKKRVLFKQLPYKDREMVSYSHLISLIGTEKQLIWTRFGAMLVANSIVTLPIGTFLSKANPSLLDRFLVAVSLVLGFALSLLWLIITIYGWKLLDRMLFEAKHFNFAPFINPVSVARGKNKCDWIKILTLSVIIVFILVYLLATAVFLYSLLHL